MKKITEFKKKVKGQLYNPDFDRAIRVVEMATGKKNLVFF
jgi:hypothetical protein